MNMEYEPLEQVRQKIRIKWYRCPIEKDTLRKLTRRSNFRGFLQALGHLALAAATGVLTYILFLEQIWIGFAFALFAHGTVATFLSGIPNHELSHGTVFRTKWLNRLFLHIFNLLGWGNHHEYEMSHTYHHRYTLHPIADREVLLPVKPSLHWLYLVQLFTINVTGGDNSKGLVSMIGRTVKTALGKYGGEWIEALYEGHPVERKSAVNWARAILLFHTAVIAVSVAFGLWLLPVLVTFPWSIGNWLRYFVGVPMHNGLRDNVPDFRKCVRSITLDPISQFLYWHMNWHAEHHMYAAVPCYNLKKLARVIAYDMPKPRSLIGAWREMRETWKRQQVDPSYQFDTPVPDPLAAKVAVGASPTDDPLTAGMGDLAPKALL